MARYTAVYTRVVRQPQTTLFVGKFREDVLKAIEPNDTVTRYGRTWRFSQPQPLDGFLVGKLGFVREADLMRTYYDERRKDFVAAPAAEPRVQYSHWVLKLDDQVLVFLKRTGEIDPQSFVGAFKALLSLHHDQALTVEYIIETASFFDWVKTVQRIVRFRAVVRPPNPGWADHPDRVRLLITQMQIR